MSYDASLGPALTVADFVVGSVLILCGVIAWDRRAESRVGVLMNLAGFTWFLAVVAYGRPQEIEKDQEPVEALSSRAADPALDVRVRVRQPDRRFDAFIPSSWKVASKARLNFASRSWIGTGALAALVEIHQQVARLLHHPDAVGAARAGDVLDPA